MDESFLGFISVNSAYALLVLALFVNFFLFGVACEQFTVMRRSSLKRATVNAFPISISGAYATAGLVLACFGLASLPGTGGVEFSLAGVAIWFLLSGVLFHLTVRFYLLPKIAEASFYLQCSIAVGLLTLLVQFGYVQAANYLQPTYASLASPLVWSIGVIALVFLFSWGGVKRGSFEEDGFKKRAVYLLGMSFVSVMSFWGANQGVQQSQAIGDANVAWLIPADAQELFAFSAVVLLVGGVFFPVFIYKRIKREVVYLLEKQRGLKAEIAGLQMHLDQARKAGVQKDQRIDWLEREARLLEHNVGVSVQGAVKAFKNLQEDLFELDIQTDTVFMQEAWRCALGYSVDTEGRIPTETFKERLNDEGQSLFESILSCLLSGELDHATILLEIKSPNEGFVKCEFKLTTVANAYGLKCAIVGIMRDRSRELSQAKEVENELSFTRDLATSRQRFLSSLSHELRTPLTTMGSALALLETMIDRGHLDADKLKRFIWQAKQASSSMRELTDQTLSLVEVKQRNLNKMEGARVDKDSVTDLRGVVQSAVKLDLKRRRKGDELLAKFDLQIPEQLHTNRGAHFWATLTRQMLAIVFYEEAIFKSCRLYLDKANGALVIDIVFKQLPVWGKCLSAGEDTLGRNGSFTIGRYTQGLPFFIELVTLVLKGLSRRIDLALHYAPAMLQIQVPISINSASTELAPQLLKGEANALVLSEQ